MNIIRYQSWIIDMVISYFFCIIVVNPYTGTMCTNESDVLFTLINSIYAA